MGFDALIPALQADNIDVALAGMSITEERKQQVIFSDPYYKSGLLVMVPKDNNDIKSIDDLKGKRIAVQIGTTGAFRAEKVEGAKVTAFNDNGSAVLEMKNGAADAVINDAPVLKYFLAQGGSEYAKTVGEVLNAEDYGIAVKKGNDKLAADINKALNELKQNGEFDKIYNKWFEVMFMKKYLVFLMAALMLVALAVAGCGGSKDEAKAQPEKVLRVATEPTFAPFEFQKEGSDELAGFDMDLIRAIGKKLGYKVEIANMGFDALIPALNTGNIDVAIAEHYR